MLEEYVWSKVLDTFRKYFADYESQYVLIGGVCFVIFYSKAMKFNFRATKHNYQSHDFQYRLFLEVFSVQRDKDW